MARVTMNLKYVTWTVHAQGAQCIHCWQPFPRAGFKHLPARSSCYMHTGHRIRCTCVQKGGGPMCTLCARYKEGGAPGPSIARSSGARRPTRFARPVPAAPLAALGRDPVRRHPSGAAIIEISEGLIVDGPRHTDTTIFCGGNRFWLARTLRSVFSDNFRNGRAGREAGEAGLASPRGAIVQGWN
jgi:hypothetical protein